MEINLDVGKCTNTGGKWQIKEQDQEVKGSQKHESMPYAMNKADTIPGCVNRNASWTTITVLPNYSQGHAGVLDQIQVLSIKEMWPKE